MVRLSVSTTLVALFQVSAVSTLVAAASSECAIKETVAHPYGWSKGIPAPADDLIQLHIGLPQPNFSVLEQHLYEVSDPDHARYGQHLSKEEVEALVAPEDESVTQVDRWLASHGFEEADLNRSPAKDWVTILVPVRRAEEMLNTSYHVWTHVKSGDQLVRTTSYCLPEHLHLHIDVIQPTTAFVREKPQRSTIFNSPNAVFAEPATGVISTSSGIRVDASCNATITIACLQQLYNSVGYTPSATNGNKIGITGYLEQFINNEDLELFFKEQRPDAVGSNYTTVSINGGQNNQTLYEAGEEADLDSQFAFGLTFPTPRTFFTTGGSPPFVPDSLNPSNYNEPYLQWLNFAFTQETLPQTISTSYGDDEQTVPESFAQRVCAGMAQLGARGVSVIFASGDYGVGDGNPDPATQECFSNDGRNVTRFIPIFPAGCPYVTTVGATVNIPEIAVTRFFSGGGFSNYFPRPAYQAAVVDAYLINGLARGAYEGLFNPAGRAYPDVAAMGDNFRIYYEGTPISIGGTSASAPTFASIISLLNDALLSAHRPPLGFLNPFLYSKGFKALTDITVGHNSGCGTTGFNATKGWDPVTGLGTPNFFQLKSLIL